MYLLFLIPRWQVSLHFTFQMKVQPYPAALDTNIPVKEQNAATVWKV